MDSGCDIPKRKWNNGSSSCTECGSGCIGCTEKVFPDYGRRGIYQNLHASNDVSDKTPADVLSKVVKGDIING
jgi:Ni,Fe-hydrogenase I small subunit